MLAGLGAQDSDPAAPLRFRANADNVDVFSCESLFQVGNVGNVEGLRQPFVELSAAFLDAGLVGDGDQAAAFVGGEGGGVVLLVRVLARHEQNAIARLHGAPPSTDTGVAERKARSRMASSALSGASGGGSAPRGY